MKRGGKASRTVSEERLPKADTISQSSVAETAGP